MKMLSSIAYSSLKSSNEPFSDPRLVFDKMTTSNLINMPSNWSSPLQFVKDFDRTNCSIRSEESTSTDEQDEEQNNDGEGIWSPDIEQSFHEALSIYPPCGRRKIILSEEGKMFGRNELISRYIHMRTGKLRSRKQVSSHIQVLAKRKCKDIQSLFKDQNIKEPHRPFVVNQAYPPIHHSPIAENTSLYYNHPRTPVSFFSPSSSDIWQQRTGPYADVKPFPIGDLLANANESRHSINSNQLKLLEFVGYLQFPSDMHSKHYLLHIGEEAGTDMKSERIKTNQIIDLFPMLQELYSQRSEDVFYVVKVWVDMNYEEDLENTYHYSSIFESSENNTKICITTKACSFGKPIVEKIENGITKYDQTIEKYVYRSTETTMCTFMSDFIKKLKTGIHMRDMMNAVLEHLGVFQTVVAKDTNELLLCIAYIFEISESSLNGVRSAAYRLCE